MKKMAGVIDIFDRLPERIFGPQGSMERYAGGGRPVGGLDLLCRSRQIASARERPGRRPGTEIPRRDSLRRRSLGGQVVIADDIYYLIASIPAKDE